MAFFSASSLIFRRGLAGIQSSACNASLVSWALGVLCFDMVKVGEFDAALVDIIDC